MSNSKSPISLARLKEVLNYDANTGDFTWRKVPLRSPVSVGDVAGGLSAEGYLYLTVDGKNMPASRAAWFMSYGEWPQRQVGHFNGDRLDNSLENLRLIEPRKRDRNALTVLRLKSLLDYEPETGNFIWRITTSNRSKIGSIAGVVNPLGYNQIGVDGERYLAHRLAWFYMTGVWPNNQIDHINGKKDDNRWVNLREATSAENTRNAPKRLTNKSGFKGVSWSAGKKKWVARITSDYRVYPLGYFATKEEAAAAYAEAAKRLHGAFASQEGNRDE